MPKPLPILPSVPAPSCPRLHSIPIIFPIDPISLEPPAHVIVIDPASCAFPLMKLPFVDVTVAINLNATARIDSFLRD
uniref:Uncharacterized protein MANES_01G273200 n=1 Tax=Rhizophora mucronata TaxID=61149 RepID=A0A2P2N6C4_RHIMU